MMIDELRELCRTAGVRVMGVVEQRRPQPDPKYLIGRGKLEEVVAMSCLPEAEEEPITSWVLWLDLWSQAARNPEVASVRQKFDERWRGLICSLVVAGQEAGEFGPVEPAEFAVLLSSLLDGFAVQIALDDPVVDASRAFDRRLVECNCCAVHHNVDRLGLHGSHNEAPGQRRSQHPCGKTLCNNHGL